MRYFDNSYLNFTNNDNFVNKDGRIICRNIIIH